MPVAIRYSPTLRPTRGEINVVIGSHSELSYRSRRRSESLFGHLGPLMWRGKTAVYRLLQGVRATSFRDAPGCSIVWVLGSIIRFSMKRQICSYDMVAVPSGSYTVTEAGCEDGGAASGRVAVLLRQDAQATSHAGAPAVSALAGEAPKPGLGGLGIRTSRRCVYKTSGHRRKFLGYLLISCSIQTVECSSR
jgi:hypothetical protein